MRERPILFSAPMVRAILDGRKTQTRRVVKSTKFCPERGSAVGQAGGAWLYGSPASLGLRDRGDHWVVPLSGDYLQRMCTEEAYGWGAGAGCPYGQPGDRLWVRETWAPCDGGFCYRADEPEGSLAKPDDGRWHPSIHMFREASRITLEVTGVRVERLQDISDADAVAEGCYSTGTIGRDWQAPVDGFPALWALINGQASWAANPWVWVVEFKRL